MLSKSSIIAARHIVSNLAYSGKSLDFKKGSILSVMSNSTDIQDNLSPDAFNTITGSAPEDFECSAESRIHVQSRMNDGAGVNVHTADTSFVVKELASRINNSISVARNFVNPIIRDIYSGASAIAQTATSTGGIKDTIRLVQPLNIYSDELLIGMIAPLVGFGSIQKDTNALFDMLTNGITAEDIVSTCATGMPSIDNKASALLRTNADSIHQYLYYCFNLDKSEVFNAHGEGIDPFDNHSLLTGFLFINGVINGRGLIDAASISVVDSNTLVKLRNEIATRLKRQMVLNQEADSTDNITLQRWSSRARRAYVVNGPNYRKWLAANEANTEGAFIVFCRSGIVDATSGTVDRNIERYNKEWATLLKTNMRTAKVEADARINAYIRRELSVAIRDTDMFDDGVRPSIQARLNERLGGRGYYNQLDLGVYVRDLCCTVLANKTDVFKILTIIDSEMESGEVELAEAISIAVDQLLADWSFGQLTVD